MTQVKKKVSPLVFIQQVQQELGRVTWASRKEVAITSVLVFVMVMLFALFFLGIDHVLAYFVRLILGWGE